MRWIDRSGDRDGDGFQEYETRSSHGYYNQGWKDAGDAIPHADGVARAAAARAVRAPGLRLRREAPDGRHLRDPRARPKTRAGCGARRASCTSGSTTRSGGRPRGPTTSASTATSGRSETRRLERRAPARSRGSCRRSGRAGSSSGCWRRRHVVGLGHPDAVVGPPRVQPVQLPHGLGLAARQRDDRRRVPALRLRRRGGPGRARHVRRRRAVPGQPAARAVRRPAPRRGQLPGPVPRRQRPAGVGRRARSSGWSRSWRASTPRPTPAGRGSTSTRRCPTGCPS